MEEFILSPFVAPIILRRNYFNNPIFKDNPKIRMGKVMDGSYMVCYVSIDLISTLLSDEKLYNVCLTMGLLSQFDLESAGIAAVQHQPYLSLRGQDVLIGFVDTGIDYTNAAFIREFDHSSKILSIWDQTLIGDVPNGYYFGAEFTRDQLNEALQAEDPFEVVPHRDSVGHGTFLASVAASQEPGMYMGVAPDADLVVVKIKRASPYYRNRFLIEDGVENVFQTSDLMLGIDYILTKSREEAKPVVICIGMGTNLGGHDGFDVLEDYLTGISYLNGVAICAAAGNESNAKHHAMGVIPSAGATQEVDLRVGSNVPSIFMGMWNSSADRMSVSLKTPIGEVIVRTPARSGETTITRLIMENAVVSVTYSYPSGGSGAQLTEIRIEDPTPGIWKLSVYGEIVLDGTYHIWMPLTGLASQEMEFLSPNPEYTVVVPACAVGVITCGAYNSRDKSLYLASSWGKTRLPSIAPDLTAPGVDVGGVFPTGYGIMSGTSVSTAITTGACALLLEWGLALGNVTSMNTYHIKSLLIQGCDREAGMVYPNDQWGYGRLNLYNTFLQMRSI
jgi:subtilisin family serine protease